MKNKVYEKPVIDIIIIEDDIITISTIDYGNVPDSEGGAPYEMV